MVVGDSGPNGRVRKGAAVGESDGVGMSEEAAAMVTGGPSCGLSFSWGASMTRREKRGECGRGVDLGRGSAMVRGLWVMGGRWWVVLNG